MGSSGPKPPDPSVGVRRVTVPGEGEGGGEVQPPEPQGPPAPPEFIGPPAPAPEIGPPAAPEPDTQQPSGPTLDWWQSLPIETRNQLEAEISELKGIISNLQGQLSDVAAGAGLKGDKGDPGTDGTNGVDGTNGTDGTDGRDGTNGRDGKDGSLFTSTPEFSALNGRIDDNARTIATVRTLADAVGQNATNAAGIAERARLDILRLQGIVEGISANPNLVPVPPSASELFDSVAQYLRQNPPTKGNDGLPGLVGPPGPIGPPGPSLPAEQVNTAVRAYLQTITIPAGKDGTNGRDGTDGKDAPPISVEDITQVLMDALGPALQLIDNPADAIWDIILQATRERLAQLFNAQLEAL